MTAQPAFAGDCFRCGQLGHIAAECDQLKPAATYSEHLARIDAIRMRFLEFEITTEQKQRLIEAENQLWKAGQRELQQRK